MSERNDASAASLGEKSAYGIERHQHLFAAWAASHAASVKGCRFAVETGRALLEASGFNAALCQPAQLPAPNELDAAHRLWRNNVITEAAHSHNLKLTHGVAAKLINCYLKSRFVCGGHHTHERVQQLHPPIDAVLLNKLAALNVGGFAKEWRRAHALRWSKFDSQDYEQVIALIRQSLAGEPLWKIEEHWRGNQ